jgi:hypothetical protein
VQEEEVEEGAQEVQEKSSPASGLRHDSEGGPPMKKHLILICAACALQLGLVSSASAGTLDQHQENQTAAPALFGGGSPQSLAQTFTAGITGGLDQVDLMLQKLNNPPDPAIKVEIRSTSAGAPGPLGAVLASASVPISSVGNDLAFIPVPIAPPIPVTAGTQYAIVAYNAGVIGNAASWGEVVVGNPYAAGAAYINTASFPPDSGWSDPGAGTDQAFRTYVVPSPTVTGKRAAALKKCKKKKSKKKRKKCRKRARKLPV